MSTGIIDQALSKLADHCIVDTGVDGSWHYTKYSDGTYTAYYSGGYALNASSGNFGSATSGLYYHLTTYGIPLPSFSTSFVLDSVQKNDSMLMFCVGLKIDSDGLHLWIVNGSTASSTGSAMGDCVTVIRGTWNNA